MQSKFFKPITKAVQLSPYFVLQALCGISLLYDMSQDPPRDGDNSKLVMRFLLAGRFILPSLRRMAVNYEDYQKVSSLLEKYGYRTKWANHFIDSSCGRKQLKMACQEQNHLGSYRQHIAEAKVRWYHIDSKPLLGAAFVGEAFFMSGAALISHNALEPKAPEEASQPKKNFS